MIPRSIVRTIGRKVARIEILSIDSPPPSPFLPQWSSKSLSFTLDVRHWPLLDAWPTRTGITSIHDFGLDSPIFLRGLQSLLDTDRSPRCSVTFLPIDPEQTRFRRGPLFRPLFAGISVFVRKNFRRCNFSNPSITGIEGVFKPYRCFSREEYRTGRSFFFSWTVLSLLSFFFFFFFSLECKDFNFITYEFKLLQFNRRFPFN